MLSGAILLALTLTVSTGAAQTKQEDKIKNIVDDIKPYVGSTCPDSFFYGKFRKQYFTKLKNE
jgi:hypothetical protein